MCNVNMYDLKTNLSKYIDYLEKGSEKEIIICRYNKKIAKIVLYEEETKKDLIGCAIGILPQKDFDLETGFEDLGELFGY